jgi:hypothetical protein
MPDGLALGWFQGYEDPLNSLRIGKSLLLALLLLPSLRSLLQAAPALAVRGYRRGMAMGLGLVSLAVLGERAAYPGLLDFSTPYRSTALFWEMHVGGAGLDAFLALTVPFVVHLLVYRPADPWHWVHDGLARGTRRLRLPDHFFARGLSRRWGGPERARLPAARAAALPAALGYDRPNGSAGERGGTGYWSCSSSVRGRWRCSVWEIS